MALRFAKKHNIVDNPDSRKLQKVPVPVFGGIVVLLGIIIPLIVAAHFYQYIDLWYMLGALLLLWILGVTDDIRGLSAAFRFIVELALVWVLIWQPMQMGNGPIINHLHGLFGRGHISGFTAIPLSIIGSVGIINAINLIDGVDGYASGFGIASNILFAIIFHILGNTPMTTFATITAAALVPFYIHNVFGKESKMFIGDGGSLIIGLILSYNIATLLSSGTDTTQWEAHNAGLIPLVLAISAIPVFDTLRVMFARIICGHSPFSPDKTHLHHAFISLGFSHVGTSTIIILMNLLIVALWFAAYRMGCSITGQFVVVVLLGLLATCGVYYGFRYAEKQQNQAYRVLQSCGKWTHFENKGIWKTIELWVDRTAFCTK